MQSTLSSSAQKVQDALKALGYNNQVIEHDQTTRTAQEAADTIGCTVGQIVKSLIFKGKTTGQPVLIVASGPNRVNEKLIKQHLGEKITRPDADYVREHTGFAIGGIPPVGLPNAITTFVDADLMQYTEIWAAAGTPRAVFKLTPQQLVEMTKGTVIVVS